jgi:hypothetical protein
MLGDDMVKLKQVFPDRLVFEVEGELVEASMDEVSDKIKAYVELVGEQPDEADLKRILKTTVRKLYAKGKKKMEKPDFTKFIDEELEEEEGEKEKAKRKAEEAK